MLVSFVACVDDCLASEMCQSLHFLHVRRVAISMKKVYHHCNSPAAQIAITAAAQRVTCGHPVH